MFGWLNKERHMWPISLLTLNPPTIPCKKKNRNVYRIIFEKICFELEKYKYQIQTVKYQIHTTTKKHFWVPHSQISKTHSQIPNSLHTKYTVCIKYTPTMSFLRATQPWRFIFGPFWIILGHSRATLGHFGSFSVATVNETLKYGTFGRKKFGFRAMSRRILKLCVASLLNILCFPATWWKAK